MVCLVEVKCERVCSAAATRAPNQKAPRLYSPLFLPRFCLIASPRHRWRALRLTARKAGDRRRCGRRRRGGRPQFPASASPYLPAAALLRRAGLGGDDDRHKREHDESGRQARLPRSSWTWVPYPMPPWVGLLGDSNGSPADYGRQVAALIQINACVIHRIKPLRARTS
jgi:hypothetical protein